MLIQYAQCNDGCIVGSGRVEEDIGREDGVHDKLLARGKKFDFNVYARHEL